MEERFLSVPWLIWAALAAVVAVLFAFVVPNGKISPTTSGVQLIVLRWFHALVWGLLALMCLLRGKLLPGGVELANMLGLLALGAYVTFLIVLLRS